MTTFKEKYGLGKNKFTAESLIELILNDIKNVPSNSQIEYTWLFGKVLLVLPELMRLNINFQVENSRDITCKRLTIYIL